MSKLQNIAILVVLLNIIGCSGCLYQQEYKSYFVQITEKDVIGAPRIVSTWEDVDFPEPEPQFPMRPGKIAFFVIPEEVRAADSFVFIFRHDARYNRPEPAVQIEWTDDEFVSIAAEEYGNGERWSYSPVPSDAAFIRLRNADSEAEIASVRIIFLVTTPKEW